MEEISIFIIDSDSAEREIKIPLGISMTLMEALKAYDEPIDSTCGGMALCASCLIEVVVGQLDLYEVSLDDEAMLDSLPEFEDGYRLSCQIDVNQRLDGLKIRYLSPTDADVQ